jgi:diadenosine tetraphosphatase ApaH/serine/threonine PP2A family protein phosphatase
MRVLVISDIHANLTALETVLEDAGEFDTVWCLGDLVGYGPDPNECVERIRDLPNSCCLAGNHDHAVLGLMPLSRFNYEAQAAVSWTQQILSEKNREYLASLPLTIMKDPFLLTHGSPREPLWEYILDEHTALLNFENFQTDYCLIGHSHIPLLFFMPANEDQVLSLAMPEKEPFSLQPRMIINPGSVGQPRDLDPRASYALLDLKAETWELRRVAYDITDVQLRILEAGLPERHATRLVAGW